MGRRPGSRLAPALLGLLLLAGCAGLPSRRDAGPVVPSADARAAAERWEAAWAQFTGLRGAVDLSVTHRGMNERTAGALLLAPARLRFEAVAPLGLPTLVVTAGPEQIVVFSPAERRAWSARATPRALQRWLGLPVEPTTLIRLLAGFPPPVPAAAAVGFGSGEGRPVVVDAPDRRMRVFAGPDGAPARVELEQGAERLVATFERAVNAAPQRLVLEAPARGASLELRYIWAEPAAVPPEAFEVLLPADVPLEVVRP